MDIPLLLMLGLGAGLASAAGVRAFIPLALAALFFQTGLVEPNATYLGIGENGSWLTAAMVFSTLALLEIILDKLPGLESVFNLVMAPVRSAAGALVAAWTVGTSMDAGVLIWFALGAVIAGTVAVLKILLRPRASTASAGVSAGSLSIFEDLVAFAGSGTGFFVPLLPLLPVAFLLFFFFRISKRRGRKYGGLRILSD
jgi:hypothetical protein